MQIYTKKHTQETQYKAIHNSSLQIQREQSETISNNILIFIQYHTKIFKISV